MMKRAYELILSMTAMIVLLIPAVITALVVSLTSEGPVWYWSKRVGLNHCLFRMPKFSTMGAVWKPRSAIATIDSRQGLKIASIEEPAYTLGYINRQKLLKAANNHSKNSYGDYLRMIAGKEVKHAF
jgi:lipopolysaccharide/colanic/teichoic acid biosynthesis glycosyltransferase